MKKYYIQDREAGNKITWFETYKQAKKQIKKYEAEDRKDGFYKEDFYEIVEEENGRI